MRSGERHALYSSPGYAARVGNGRDMHIVLVGKPEAKRRLERPRCRWEDNIKIDLQEIG
jgi:hypothetical protein